ncbi:putative toxin-antitoxin system toxin component, PIN family [Synechococcus sp. PCC 6312]|uniref:putative toxin-antitoxin system toxin component, PIN family n=1 Tax=Synechococcus sp. (strain ATCC 27167 / PCC 6312) TaxID=195253 RepID=UPI00029EED42|nr:putative toxin-antitoxin system toxin component, PIN family [Synechococcus sp. PCC 6312]AFY60856.1 putative toxin-antitoxin system toxin component, PIN family [Synechococcus sp. PCC 6312]
MSSERFVVDCNILVSAALSKVSVSRQGLNKVIQSGTLLFSQATLTELELVLSRPKFTRYITPLERQLFIFQVVQTAEIVSIDCQIQACSDPKDDMYLELAVSGKATLLLTGDRDLLTLNPYQGIPILTLTQWLDLREA